MPTEVHWTTAATLPGSVTTSTGPSKDAAKASARAAVRFITRTVAPNRSNAAVAARATPPAPSTNADCPCKSTRSERASSIAMTSVLNACNCPEASTCNVLAAPERRVASSQMPPRSATNEANVSLCGKVTDKPRRSSPGWANQASKVATNAVASGAMGKGKYTALRCCSAKAWLWKAGDLECSTGQPATPYTSVFVSMNRKR